MKGFNSERIQFWRIHACMESCLMGFISEGIHIHTYERIHIWWGLNMKKKQFWRDSCLKGFKSGGIQIWRKPNLKEFKSEESPKLKGFKSEGILNMWALTNHLKTEFHFVKKKIEATFEIRTKCVNISTVYITLPSFLTKSRELWMSIIRRVQ